MHENEQTAHLGISAGQVEIDTGNAGSYVTRTLKQPRELSAPIRQIFINESELLPIFVCSKRTSKVDLYADSTATWFEYKNLSSRLQQLRNMYRASIDAHLRGVTEVPKRTADLFAKDYYDGNTINIIPNYLYDEHLNERGMRNDYDDDDNRDVNVEFRRAICFKRSLQPHYPLVIKLNARHVQFCWRLRLPPPMPFF